MSNGMSVVIWLIVAIALAIFEGVTVQLVSVWFVIGTFPAMVAAALGVGGKWQFVIFLGTSILVLLIGRPIVKKKLTVKKQATNADRVIGMTGLVLEEVDNLKENGRVSANGLDWTARTSDNDLIITKGTRVKVIKIDGVKLIVAPEVSTVN